MLNENLPAKKSKRSNRRRHITWAVIALLAALTCLAGLAVASWWQTLAIARNVESGLKLRDVTLSHGTFVSKATGIRAKGLHLKTEGFSIDASRIDLSIPIHALWSRSPGALDCALQSVAMTLDPMALGQGQVQARDWPSLSVRRGALQLNAANQSLANVELDRLYVEQALGKLQIEGRGRVQLSDEIASSAGLLKKYDDGKALSAPIDIEFEGEVDLAQKRYRLQLSALGAPYLQLQGDSLSLLTRDIELSGVLGEPEIDLTFFGLALGLGQPGKPPKAEIGGVALHLNHHAGKWQFVLEEGQAYFHPSELRARMREARSMEMQVEAQKTRFGLLRAPEDWSSAMDESAHIELATAADVKLQGGALIATAQVAQGLVRIDAKLDDVGGLEKAEVTLDELKFPLGEQKPDLLGLNALKEIANKNKWLSISGGLSVTALPPNLVDQAPTNPRFMIEGNGKLAWSHENWVAAALTAELVDDSIYTAGTLSLAGERLDLNGRLGLLDSLLDVRMGEWNCSDAYERLPRDFLRYYDPHELSGRLSPHLQLHSKRPPHLSPGGRVPELDTFALPCRAMPLSLDTAGAHLKKDPYASGMPWRIITDHGPVYALGEGEWSDENEIVIYIHGYWEDVDQVWREHNLTSQFAVSGRRALFLVPEAPMDNSDSVQWTHLDDLLQSVRQTGLDVPNGPVTVVGHSGAYRTIASWLSTGSGSKLKQIILLDALYAQDDLFAEYARKGQLIMVGAQTDARSRRFMRAFPKAPKFEELPETFEENVLKAPLVYIATRRGHREIVVQGEVMPQLLRNFLVKPTKP